MLSTNPAFLLIELDDNNFVFYNSLQHKAARLTKLEVLILDMVFTYRDYAYIINRFPISQRNIIEKALKSIEKDKLLLCDEIIVENNGPSIPFVYYIHLTYRCNLKCNYCYNKSIRNKNQSSIEIEQWMKIITKILPYAKRIILTGGECFLYPEINQIVEYIKTNAPNIVIAAISNGMQKYNTPNNKQVLENLDELSLSCDSLYREGDRIGFEPETFRNNIDFVRNNFPNVNLTILSVYTKNNSCDILKTQEFCKSSGITFEKNIVLPECSEDIEMMPSLNEIYNGKVFLQANREISNIGSPRIKCGAGNSVCSIDPIGNVFPCQNLHYPEFKLGNLLDEDVTSIFAKDRSIIKNVNELPVCCKCKVKYLCGGGCQASGYSLYGKKMDRNHLTCPINYLNALEKLKSLNNRL